MPQKLCLTRCHLTQQREELRLLQSLERRVSSITNYGYLDLPEAEGVLALLVFPFENNFQASLGDLRGWSEMGNPLKCFKIIVLFFFFPFYS